MGEGILNDLTIDIGAECNSGKGYGSLMKSTRSWKRWLKLLGSVYHASRPPPFGTRNQGLDPWIGTFLLWPRGHNERWEPALDESLHGSLLSSTMTSKGSSLSVKVIEKLCLAREKGYIGLVVVADSLTSLFEVPKGLIDIWMDYNRTKSGLNDMLWAPWLFLCVTSILSFEA